MSLLQHTWGLQLCEAASTLWCLRKCSLPRLTSGIVSRSTGTPTIFSDWRFPSKESSISLWGLFRWASSVGLALHFAPPGNEHLKDVNASSHSKATVIMLGRQAVLGHGTCKTSVTLALMRLLNFLRGVDTGLLLWLLHRHDQLSHGRLTGGGDHAGWPLCLRYLLGLLHAGDGHGCQVV